MIDFDLKDWWEYEKKDLQDGFRVYPKKRFLYLTLIVVFLLWVFFRLWAMTSSSVVDYWDGFIVERVKEARTPFWDERLSFFTHLGSGIIISFIFLVLVIFLFQRRRKRAAVASLLIFCLSLLVMYFLNNFLSRPRPFGCVFTSLKKSCFSFPSTHAGASFYFYGILLYLIARFVGLRKRTLGLLSLCFVSLVGLVGISRIYLGYHFLTDVLAGFLLGAIFLLIAAILIDFFYHLKF